MRRVNFSRKNLFGKRIHTGQVLVFKNKEHTSSREKLKKSALFYLVCLIGCLSQMIQVSLHYFSYDTVTNLRMHRPDYIYPPSMSLCFPYICLVNFTLAFREQDLKDYAEKLSNELNFTTDFSTYQMKQYHQNDFDRQFTAYLTEHFSVAQIMLMTNRIEDWIIRCMVINPESYVPNLTTNISECFEIWSIDSYMKYDQKCFEISLKSRNLTRRSQYNNDLDVSYIYKFERLVSNFLFVDHIWYMQLNSTLVEAETEFVAIFLHPFYRKPAGQTDPMIVYERPGRNHVAWITYARSKNILLPKPYKSDCNKYLSNRNQEINDCILKRSLAKYNRVHLAAVIPSESQIKTFAVLQVSGNLTLYKELESLILNCFNSVPQLDCMWEVYKPELLTINEGGVGFSIELRIPSTPDFENRFIPQLTLLEYLIYSGSVLGIWFGLSLVRLPYIFSYTSAFMCFRNIGKRSKY